MLLFRKYIFFFKINLRFEIKGHIAKEYVNFFFIASTISQLFIH